MDLLGECLLSFHFPSSRPFLENFISIRTATYPGNTMIKRMQSNGAGGKPKVYSGAIDCLRQILRKEGVGGATLFAPLEMLNEGDLFPGALWENRKMTLLVWFRPRFLALKEYTALANSFVRGPSGGLISSGMAMLWSRR